MWNAQTFFLNLISITLFQKQSYRFNVGMDIALKTIDLFTNNRRMTNQNMPQ